MNIIGLNNDGNACPIPKEPLVFAVLHNPAISNIDSSTCTFPPRIPISQKKVRRKKRKPPFTLFLEKVLKKSAKEDISPFTYVQQERQRMHARIPAMSNIEGLARYLAFLDWAETMMLRVISDYVNGVQGIQPNVLSFCPSSVYWRISEALGIERPKATNDVSFDSQTPTNTITPSTLDRQASSPSSKNSRTDKDGQVASRVECVLNDSHDDFCFI